ncbi:MAG: cobyric acid synthase [archaeon]|nr:cobyric acid synthase [archaeon]
MRSVLFLGTASGAGKTTLAALYCRYLRKKGVDVVPYKTSNLSLNSYVTEDGKEIGMGQAFQAWASGIEPTGDMNPVLLKPSGNGRMQIVVRGEPFIDIVRGQEYDREKIKELGYGSFDRLVSEHETVVCEGSGSPVELNLMDTDLANVGLMRARKVPSVLVADIERGGVFAAVYGTWKLLPDDVRGLLKGFIINRFRGDASLLDSGIARIEELTGLKCIGIIPYETLKFPEEDSMSSKKGSIGDGNLHEEFVKNLDRLLELAEEGGVDFSKIEKIVDSSA